MKNMTNYLLLFFIVVSVVACGSSSGGGSSGSANQVSQAKINAGNAKQLGTAATEAAKQAVLNDTASILGLKPAAKPGIGTITNELSKNFAGRTANIPTPGFDCGLGSADETTNPDGSTTIIFIDCDLLGLGLLEFDGTVIASTTISGNSTTVDLEYINFTIDDGVDVVTLDMQASCTTDNTSMETICTFSDIVGFDGRIYAFSSATVSGDAITGYYVSATIIDPDHGSFSIATTAPVLFTCPNGQPISGELQFTDGAGVLVTVTFNDCTSFTVSYSGTSEIFFW
ncbi:MAG: hypothetical protein GY935_16865 [Gammaproteobacteria bacterium]|nr:hypothetical protein [Gammaproteobacteria bacterium]